MTAVAMKVQISGTRDGVDWPAPGEVLEVDEAEAAQLIAQGNAVEYVEAEPVVETADAPAEGVETR